MNIHFTTLLDQNPSFQTLNPAIGMPARYARLDNPTDTQYRHIIGITGITDFVVLYNAPTKSKLIELLRDDNRQELAIMLDN